MIIGNPLQYLRKFDSIINIFFSPPQNFSMNLACQHFKIEEIRAAYSARFSTFLAFSIYIIKFTETVTYIDINVQTILRSLFPNRVFQKKNQV